MSSPPLSRRMAPKQQRRPVAETEEEAHAVGGWVRQTAQRLEVSRTNYPKAAQPSPLAFGAAMRTEMDAGSSGGASSSDAPSASEALAATRRMHRHGGEGLLATGFEPQRHSVMVLGRPVQALGGCVL